MRKTIRDWYEGIYVPHKNDPNSPLVFVGGFYRRHWTARVASVVVGFYLREWKWVLGVMFGAPTALLALKNLLS